MSENKEREAFEVWMMNGRDERPRDGYVVMMWHAWQARAALDRSAEGEEMIRFCPECGHLGEVSKPYIACCPDSLRARIVPKRFAEICAETFRLLIDKAPKVPEGYRLVRAEVRDELIRIGASMSIDTDASDEHAPRAEDAGAPYDAEAWRIGEAA